MCISAQHPQGLEEGYWMQLDECYWMDKQNQNCVRREGYFNVILSSPTLDKGLAALKLAVTSKQSLV